MLFVRPPAHEELIELKRMTRQEMGRVSQRAQLILLSEQHRSVPTIAKLFETNPKTVRYWLTRFNQHGPAGLYDEPRCGRPRKVTPTVAAHLAQLVANDPQQAGYVATFWTVARLVVSLFQHLGVQLAPGSVRATLHKIGLRWGRPRLSMPLKVDPEKAVKQWALVQSVLAVGPTTVVLYADESRVHLLPMLRAMWHPVGQQLRIPTPGSNVTRTLFGALNIDTGQWVDLVRERMKAADFIVFLEHLLVVYAEVPIVLIVDNYSIHTAGLVKVWLARHPRLQLHYLPKYCSHLNPVEAIWLRLKNTIAADRLYGSIHS